MSYLLIKARRLAQRANFRRTVNYAVKAEELHLLDEVIAGRMQLVDAGMAMGASYNNAGSVIAQTLLRATRQGYYVRSDKEAPK